jgi:hypothetical protein
MIAFNDPVVYSAVNIDLKKGVEINKFQKMLGHCWNRQQIFMVSG